MSDCGIVRIITCTSFGILFGSVLRAVFSTLCHGVHMTPLMSLRLLI
nr:MAG TPA: hypothetical protein [Caudoviricetes sp.]